MNIKKGDLVVVIAGNAKDLTTPKKVLQVLRVQNKVVVEGVHIVTRHTKPTAQETKGGIVKHEAPIHASNVMLWDTVAKRGSRIKKERGEKNKLKRVLKKSGETL